MESPQIHLKRKDIPRHTASNNVAIAVKNLVQNRTMIFPIRILGEVQLDQLLRLQLLPSYWIDLILLEEGEQHHEIKDISMLVTIRVFKRLKGQRAVVERKATKFLRTSLA